MTVEKLAGEWFDKLISEAESRLDGVASNSGRQAGMGALKVLSDNKDGLIALGKDNVMEFLGMVGRGDSKEARKFFIAKTEDPDALIKDMEAGADRINDAPDLNWAEVVEKIVIGLGEVGAKVALAALVGLL